MPRPDDSTFAGREGTTFHGTLSDGHSAQAAKVKVVPETQGLRIVPLEQAGSTRFWAWRDLTANGPLRPGEPPLLGNADDPDARLFIDDARAVPLLLRHAPQLSTRRHHARLLLPMLAAALLLLLLGAWLWFGNVSVARTVADILPDSLHRSLGRALVQGMTHGKVCAAPRGLQALQRMTRKLAPDWPPGAERRVIVAPIGMVNAFTTPGGYIVIGRKLIDFAQSPDEVAAVLAHEMGHTELKHPEAALVRLTGLSVVTTLILGDNVFGNAALLLGQLRFSRRSETAADTVSIRRMRRAGANPAALATFFARLEKKYGGPGDSGRLSAMFQTHPPTAERIRIMKQARLPNAHPILNAEEWQALRHICDWTKTLVFTED